ncbi:melatonin receptor type 1C-like [Amphiura filiformis]|uniref:melatonin receptor type 1C-like n=1 Tax=Amphiura filiformis TaxID=82378 RepID=UPI003B211E0D
MSTNSPEIVEVHQYSEFVQIAALVLGIPICILSFAGNLLTIITVIKTKSLQTGANIFIVGLSISDMIYGTFLLPIIAYNHYNNGWPFGDGFCAVFGFFVFLFVMESINNLVGIAFSRYLKILHPKIFDQIFQGNKRTICLLLVFWLLPLITLTPAILLQKFGYEPKTLSCTFMREDNDSFGLMLLSLFLIPLSFITFCYLRILCKVVSNHKRIERVTTRTSGQKRIREDYHYTRTMVTIFIVFLLAYTPYMLNSFINTEGANLTLCFLCSVPVWLSNCINPFVYAASNRQFRLAFWAILTRRKTLFEPSDIEDSPGSNRLSMKTLSNNNMNTVVMQMPTTSTHC